MSTFTARPYTYITHLAEGYASWFKVSSNIRLSEMQLKKAQNTPITVRTNRSSMPSEVRPINWENEHDWGPVSGRAGIGQIGWWTTAGQQQKDTQKDTARRQNQWRQTRKTQWLLAFPFQMLHNKKYWASILTLIITYSSALSESKCFYYTYL